MYYVFEYASTLTPTVWTAVQTGAVTNPTITLPAVGSYNFRVKAVDPALLPTFADSVYTYPAPGQTTTVTTNITVIQALNGTITPGGTGGVVSVLPGGSQIFTITPAVGSTITSIVVDGVALAPASSAGATYTFTNVTTNHTISAVFAGPLTTSDVRINANYYPTVQDAYNAAITGSVIQLRTGILTGSLLAARPIDITFSGGFDLGYTVAAGVSTIHGPVVVRQGSIRNLNIRIMP
jgi:hypothetical protein